MGSFSYKCTASRLPIEMGDVCYVVPMRLSPIGEYQPVAPPIKGVYDDYGHIEKIEENENTKALEAYFGGPIDHILRVFGSIRGDNRNIPQKIEYNSCGDLMKYFGPNINWLSYGFTPKDLRQLGFEIDDTGLISHPQFEESPSRCVVKHDGECWRIYRDDVAMRNPIEDLCYAFSEHFIFGVSSDYPTQQKMRMMNDGKISFIRADVYEHWIQLQPCKDWSLYSHCTDDQAFDAIEKFSKVEFQFDPIYGEIEETLNSFFCGLFWNPFQVFRGHWCRAIFDRMVDFTKFYGGLVTCNGKLEVENFAGFQYCDVESHLEYAKVNLKILQGIAERRRVD